MEQIPCPVCTLFLREGMSLQRHLYTHPKAQVIAALARLAGEKSDKIITRAKPQPPPPPPLQQLPPPPLQQLPPPPLQQLPPPPTREVTSITYQQFLSRTTSFVSPTPCIVPPEPLALLVSNSNRNSRTSPAMAILAPTFHHHLSEPANVIHNLSSDNVHGHQQQQHHLHHHHHHQQQQPHHHHHQQPHHNHHQQQLQLQQLQQQQQQQNHHHHHQFVTNDTSAMIGSRSGSAMSNASSNTCHSQMRPDSAVQYTQLENMAYRPTQQHDNSHLLTMMSNSLPPPQQPNSMQCDDDRDVMNIGTVITDSQRIISNSPISVSGYLNDPNKSESDDALPPSPASMGGSSVYSVRVRKDLSENDASSIHLTPPLNEYIVPGFDDYVDDAAALENSAHSMPLNIHTDESMPPRGELSGHGTDSGSMWQVLRNVDGHLHEANNQSAGFNLSVGSGAQEKWKDPTEEDVDTPPDITETPVKEVEILGVRKRRSRTTPYRPPVVRKTSSIIIHQPTRQVQPSAAPVQETFSNVFVKPERERIVEDESKALDIKVDVSTTIKTDTEEELNALNRERPRRKPRTCRTCEETFPTIEDFKFHLRKVHPLECNICGKYFVRSSGLSLHQKRHLKIKPYKCDLCDKTFVTNQKLVEHHNGHTGETPLKCSHCDRSFKRYSNLIQHTKFTHLKVKRKVKDYYCHCGDVFHSQRKLAWHKETHDTKPKQCMFCSERYVHASSLTRHIRRVHNSNYIPKMSNTKGYQMENVECPICHRTCVKSSLRAHIMIHSGVRPFSCITCGKRFFSKWNMKLHQWTHASRSSKPFKCKLCKAAFVREPDLISHTRSHKNIRPYSCNHCGRQFVRKYNCLRHSLEHETNKRFGCEVCGKQFHRGYYLKDHMRVHTGMKPYSCHICSKTTATKTNHNKHLKTHHAREPVNSEN